MNPLQRVFVVSYAIVGILISHSVALAQDPATAASLAEPPCCCQSAGDAVSKRSSAYQVPDVLVRDQTGKTISLIDAFPQNRVIVMQFAFTSCSTICPVASATMATTQRSFEDATGQVSFVTISIDPEFDTPVRLAEYATELNAAEGWLFLTGQREAIAEVQKAFAAYVPNKSRHEALTFLRPAGSDRWVRLTGLVSAERLSDEVRELITTPERRADASP